MRIRIASLILVLAAAAAGRVTLAHHSTAAYDTKTITLKNAIVTRLVWANPHCVLWLEVKDGRGRAAAWGIESGSPSALTRVGWHRTVLKPGDAVAAVEVYPARNGAQVGRLAKVVLPGGRELLDSLYKDSPFDTIQRK
jgi:hypothetical protein